ncbi:MAG: hypothetical protein ACJATA_000353 [Sphingobacteriales bacterium]|jgi:hypothetical protein
MHSILKIKNPTLGLIAGMVLLTIVGCRYDKETFLKPKFESSSTVPLAFGEIVLGNEVKFPDSLITLNDDSSYSIVFEKELLNQSLEGLVEVPEFNSALPFSIDSLSFSFSDADVSVTLADVVRNNSELKEFIDSNQGKHSIVPDFEVIETDPSEFLLSDVESILIKNGSVTITIENHLAFPMDSFTFKVKNPVSGDFIINQTFYDIDSGDSKSETINLAGKTVRGKLQVITIVDLRGSDTTQFPIDSFYIDSAQSFSTNLSFSELSSTKGVAVVAPIEQSFADEFSFNLAEGVQLKQIYFTGGEIAFNLKNSFEMELSLTLNFPTIKKDGVGLSLPIIIPPRVGTTIGEITERIILSEYVINLNQEDPKFNILPFAVDFGVDSKGELVSFNAETDSLQVGIAMTGTEILKVIGDIGSDTTKLEDENGNPFTIDLFNDSLFSSINQGVFKLSEIEFKLGFENLIGADAQVNLDLSSTNALTGETVSLTSDNNNQFLIKSALDNPLRPAPDNNIILNEVNSNIDEVISNLPKQITAKASIITNPNLNPESFIYTTSSVKASIFVEAPLSFVISNLSFADTFEFDNSAIPQDELLDELLEELFESGELTININNYFPLSLDINVELLDKNGEFISEFIINNSNILGGIVNDNFIVVEPSFTKVTIPLNSKSVIDLRSTTHLRIQANLNSSNGDGPVKILSNSKIEFAAYANIKVKN